MTLEIPITGKRGEGKIALVNNRWKRFKNYKWHLSANGSAATLSKAKNTSKTVLMHRVVTGAQDLRTGETLKPVEIKHRNKNKLDNRDKNLYEGRKLPRLIDLEERLEEMLEEMESQLKANLREQLNETDDI